MIEGGEIYNETVFVQTVGKLRPVIHNIGFDPSGRFAFRGSDEAREHFANLMQSYAIYPEDELPEGRTPIFPQAFTGANDGATTDTAAAGDGEPPAADDQEAAEEPDGDRVGHDAANTPAQDAGGPEGGDVGTTGSQGAAVADDDGFI